MTEPTLDTLTRCLDPGSRYERRGYYSLSLQPLLTREAGRFECDLSVVSTRGTRSSHKAEDSVIVNHAAGRSLTQSYKR